MINNKITLSADKHQFITRVHAVQGENNSRTLEIELLDNENKTLDLSNSRVFFYVVQNRTVQQSECEVYENKAKIELSSSMLIEPGNKPCWLQIVNSDGSELRVDNLSLEIQKCPIDDAIEASSEFSVLVKLIKKVEDLIDSGGSGGGPVCKIGNGLKLDRETNTLSVDTTDKAEVDNTKPITSAGVNTIVGNIDALLKII